MPIYTRRGDGGETDLRGGDRISKASPRIESYGTVDELNALIGVLRSHDTGRFDALLGDIQEDLHVIQAELASRSAEVDPRIDDDDVARLEARIDEFETDLEPLTSFILPGGSEVGARLHHLRTVARRAERRVVALEGEGDVSEAVVTYLNRLSDLLFVLARAANADAGVEEDTPSYGA